MSFKGYEILETDSGPMISESRTSVYDVLLSLQEGEGFEAICEIYNLDSKQVEVALAYIVEHRTELEATLPELLKKKAEREQYYRSLVAERQKIPVEMTPLRQAFYVLQEKNRKRLAVNGTSHSE